MDIRNHEADLKCINDYLLSFFEFAANSSNAVFDENEWLAFKPGDGKWLYSRYKREVQTGNRIKQAIDGIFAMDKPQRNVVYQAIAHDMKFAEDLANSFEFQTIQLEAKAQELIKAFFLYFYENALSSSWFEIDGLSMPRFGRDEFAEEYFKGENENIRFICPVCLQTVTDGMLEEHIEHYFPKAYIPCLALHPNNLYFICGVCNGRYKQDKKYSDNGNTDIRKIFLPYADTVKDKVAVKFEHKIKEDTIDFVPADINEDYIEDKIETFNYYFQLPQRWSKSLERYNMTAYRKYKRRNPTNKEKLKHMIEKDAKDIRTDLNIRPEMYLEEQYLEWLGSVQLRAFYSNVKHEGKKAVVVED
ncbi:MAG: hypothetical protein HDR23_10240 [Lachnospiraceae bacterium]|nr:hypothetical protein [Lachnospiraceae bacterium]